ncbi:hypothetical protein [Peribacillus simplex]|uniref:hypothetical protein n=1 Tax=Peribacillus simplex TaxID=1478 RepID=UPI003D2DD670
MKDLLGHELEPYSMALEKGKIKELAIAIGMITQFSTAWSQLRMLVMMLFLFRSLSCKSLITMAVMAFKRKWRFVGKVVEKKADNVVVGEVQAKNSEGDIKVSGIFEAVLPSSDL